MVDDEVAEFIFKLPVTVVFAAVTTKFPYPELTPDASQPSLTSQSALPPFNFILMKVNVFPDNLMEFAFKVPVVKLPVFPVEKLFAVKVPPTNTFPLIPAPPETTNAPVSTLVDGVVELQNN